MLDKSLTPERLIANGFKRRTDTYEIHRDMYKHIIYLKFVINLSEGTFEHNIIDTNTQSTYSPFWSNINEKSDLVAIETQKSFMRFIEEMRDKEILYEKPKRASSTSPRDKVVILDRSQVPYFRGQHLNSLVKNLRVGTVRNIHVSEDLSYHGSPKNREIRVVDGDDGREYTDNPRGAEVSIFYTKEELIKIASEVKNDLKKEYKNNMNNIEAAIRHIEEIDI